MAFKLFSRCTYCGGSGIIIGNNDPYDPGPPEELSCNWCGGDGMLEFGVFFDEDVFPSFEILEAIDVSEYNALTDAQKDGVKILLSCGFVDFRDGMAGKTRLWGWFGEGTTTRTNLEALLA